MMCGIVCPHEDCPKDCVHRAVADRMQDLTGGAVDVVFSPNSFTGGDEKQKGHLYSGWLSSENEDFLYFDDRGPEPLEVQLVKELRRLGEYCLELATKTEVQITARQLEVARA